MRWIGRVEMAVKKQPTKTLERIPSQGLLAGVCAGLADYFEVDITVMRLIFVVVALALGGIGGVILYIALAIFMPVQGEEPSKGSQALSSNVNKLAEELKSGEQVRTSVNWLGIALITLGVWLLAGQLFPGWLVVRWEFIWPMILVLIGLVIVMRSRR